MPPAVHYLMYCNTLNISATDAAIILFCICFHFVLQFICTAVGLDHCWRAAGTIPCDTPELEHHWLLSICSSLLTSLSLPSLSPYLPPFPLSHPPTLPPSQMFFWSEAMEFVISVAGAIIFCGFIIFDTHLIMHKLSPEEYILASVNLYLDFINLFLYILRILQAMRRE